MPIPPLALSDADVCASLGLNLSTKQITQLRRRGEFPPSVLIGGRPVVLMADLEAWLLKQQEASALAVARRQQRARTAAAARWSRAA